MKLKDDFKSYSLTFLIGILAGVICRMSDSFSYEDLWSLSSIATMFGFWIASVVVITYLSSSHKGAFIHTFLYMFGMTLSFYGLQYLFELSSEAFSSDPIFQTNLFLLYSALSVVCGIGSAVLYYWNNENEVGSILCALPASGMLAEAIACSWMLLNYHILLAQTLFDFAGAFIFLYIFSNKATHKVSFAVALGIATVLIFLVLYQPFLS